jgi:predicted glutamine amidotransferase
LLCSGIISGIIMCRWVAYLGSPIFLEDFVSRPSQSLVAQSLHCHEAKSQVNADGFGLAWYGERQKPGVFRDIRPAWSDENLLSIAHQIRSRLFMAHVRASTGTATTRANCHPFVVEHRLFMHNGQVPGWEKLRRRIESSIPDELFQHRGGTTDSEALFLLMLANGLADDPKRAATTTLAFVEDEMRRAGIAEPVKITAAISDGETLSAIRYSTDGNPPTLYTKACCPEGGTLVVSEPLDNVRDGWTAVPAQSFVTVNAKGVKVEPFAPSDAVRARRATTAASKGRETA